MPLTDSFQAPVGRLSTKTGRSAEAHVTLFDRHLLSKAVDSLAARPLASLDAAETITMILGLDYLSSRAVTGMQVDQTKRQVAEQDVPAAIAARVR